jgi:preprotein translocase subunit SecA
MLFDRHLQLPVMRRAWRQRLTRISHLGPRYRDLSTEELRRDSLSLRYRAISGEPAARLMPEAYALMREAAERTLGLRHYDVQLFGGIALYDGSVAEMQTGEGKTLTATLPLYLAALMDFGAHLATANDYLAERDARLMGPAFELLGMQVGTLQSASDKRERRRAYRCDVTYGAAREFGFDFLRDRLRRGESASNHGDLLGRMLGCEEVSEDSQSIQRELYFMLVDEADSVLIDEARTPLIVSSVPADSIDSAPALYRWSAAFADGFRRDDDYEFDSQSKSVALTRGGRRRVREQARPDELSSIPLFDLYEYVERAVRVALEFRRDQHYVVRDGQIVIVDESTGRLADGRKWRDGLHQAIEAREGLEVTVKTGDAARITVQDFFLLYSHLAGMTGTATSSRGEFRGIYELNTQIVPTNRTVQRVQLPDRVFGSAEAKWEAVVEETGQIHATGRPVLIGTRSIHKSELLSELLTLAGIPHEVLNANRHAEEAEIVAAAGTLGKVTVATNMAGRGTDIKLGEGVCELGGLHVTGTELHDSQRIDRQLYGRCARQGDPGSYRQYAALDDDVLLGGLSNRKSTRYRTLGQTLKGELAGKARLFRRAQLRIERQHYRQRKMLLHQEKQRREVQKEMGQDPYLDSPS